MSSPGIPLPPARKVRAVNCPNCGGNIDLRGFGNTRSAVCVQCCTIIDPSTPELKILQQFDDKMREQPLIPLGTRGKFRGALYEAIGFQVRTITVDGIDYSWHEYLLFNPYKGYRYLTQYNGHWNDVLTLHALPAFTSVRGRKAAICAGRTYMHFQHAQAATTFVMGEFPWQVRVNELSDVDDYIAPPYVISSELTSDEINWSQGIYLSGAEVWQSFQLKGSPPTVFGVYSNQPSPYGASVSSAWSMCFKLLIVWAVLLAYFTFSASNREIFGASYHFEQSTAGEHSFVTEPFEIPGRTSNVEVEIKTDLDNNWAYFNLALLREDGSQGFDFGRDVSYYSGRDSDGNWSEGKATDSVVLPRVPPGRYYLRIEPEMDPEASQRAPSGMTMNYQISLRRDVPTSLLFWLVLPLLILPPLVKSFRSAAFENRRWQESDYSTAVSSGGDGGDD
jgi:hypothetical protein